MFARLGRIRTILCLTFFLGIQAGVVVENKAYQNVAVSFSPRLSSENAPHLVSSLQEVLKETSSVLQEAIGLRIGSVTFHFPRTWNNVSLEGISLASGPHGKELHDIHVEALSDSAFGKHPHTIQYGGCGIPGEEIVLPNVFLSEEESYPKGKILAKEWLKYRYGVFDENGFTNDPMYPTHYSVAGSDDVHVTECTFPKVEYEFRDLEGMNCTLSAGNESNCLIHPNEETAANVSSSLMFYHKELPQVGHICGTGDHVHNEDSPNKQNLLCHYKSVWEIVKSSDDLAAEEETEATEEKQEITFSYVRESPVRLVATWQNTQSLQKQGPTILKAVNKLLHDLPLPESKVALYDFKENIMEIRGLSELKTDDIRGIVWKSEFGKEVDQPCVSCAVDKAVEVLLEDGKDEPGTVLVMTDFNPAEDYINQNLKDSKLCLRVIGFPGASEEQWKKMIENSDCSSFSAVSSTVENAIFEELYEIFSSVLPEPVDDTKITTVTTDYLTKDTDFVIPADENAEEYLMWIFGSKEEDSIECKTGETKVEHKEVGSSQTLSVFVLLPQKEDIKCRLSYSEQALAQAQMRSKPGAYFHFQTWSHDTTAKNQTEQMPVVIYASLSYGQYPVLNAEVKAVVTHPDGHKTELPLYDNGLSDPDVTKNDGIYSRYFTDIISEGTYKVEVHATSSDQKTRIGKEGQDSCCGSIVMNKEFDVSSFDLKSETNFEAISKKPEKGYKPSRVVDLKVDKLEFPKSVSLKWTAPGGEMDGGQAHQYEFKIFCQHKDCNESGILPSWIILSSKLKPKEFGNEENFVIDFSEKVPEDIVVYFSVTAISKGLQLGDSSNLVSVRMSRSDPTDETKPPITDDRSHKSPEAGVIVAYVLITLALLMIIAGVVYFVLERKRRRNIPDDLNTPVGFGAGNENKAFSFQPATLQKENAMERAEALPVQLYTHDQIKDIRQKQKESPKQRSGLGQKSWNSLDALSGEGGNAAKRNPDSASITQIDLRKTNEEEIKQLDDVSQRSVPFVVRDSKF